jgi:prolipoprotein diacylglyceryltransferase
MPTLPLKVALVVKLGVWALALCAFLAMLASRFVPLDLRMRRLLGAVLVGAFVGSKLLHGLSRVAPVDPDFADMLLWWYGGDSVAGALIGARLALWLAGRDALARRVADGLVAPAGVALIILACGSVFWALRDGLAGGVTGRPWGMDFGDGLTRHPLMLYEAALLSVLLVVLPRGDTVPPGLRSGLFIAGYLCFTLATGFLRPPFVPAGLMEIVMPRTRLVLGLLSLEQCACLFTIGMMAPGIHAAWRARPGARRRS